MSAPLEVEGPTAPPRCNGELVFDHPWEGRAFCIAVSLYEANMFTWPEFQQALADRIGRWQFQSADNSSWTYYEHWLGALTDVLAAGGVIVDTDVAERAVALAHRPDGHDHRH